MTLIYLDCNFQITFNLKKYFTIKEQNLLRYSYGFKFYVIIIVIALYLLA